jgi:hypothetical protein
VTPEKNVQNAILREFGTRPGLRIWRANTGVAVYGDRRVRFGVPGQADVTGILPGGIRLEIECKAPGKRQTTEQANYQRMIERFNGVYVLAYGVADVWAAIGKYIGGAE